MEKLKGFQKKYLRGLAHGVKPQVFVGQNAISPTVIKALNEALDTHELIKVKFVEFKEKDQKQELAGVIEKETKSEMVGMIGHMVLFYRQQKDSEKRKIIVPVR